MPRDSSLKVLLLGPYPPPHGGVQTHLVALKQFLEKRGIPAAVINLYRFRGRQDPHVYYPRTAPEVVHLLLRLRYPIVHMHFGGNLTWRLTGVAAFCSLLPWAKTVLTFHSGGYPSSPAGRKVRRWGLKALVLRHLDALIGVNQELVQFFQRLGVQEHKIHQISPFALPEWDEEYERAGWKEQLREFVASHRPLLISVSGLEPEYDIPTQLQALKLVLATFPGAGLLVVGSGRQEEELRGLVEKLDYKDHVLLAGDVTHPVVMKLVRSSDVFLRTTLYDGDAISVREALYLGTPVIATDNGMRPAGCILVPKQNPELLAKKIIEVLESPPERKPVAAGSGDENLARVLEIYEQLINQRSQRM